MHLKCLYCLDIFKSSQESAATVCGHVFHVNCVYPWLREHSTCPECRTACSAAELLRIYFSGASEEDFHTKDNCDVTAIQRLLDNEREQVANLKDDLKDLAESRQRSDLTEIKKVNEKLETDLQIAKDKIRTLRSDLLQSAAEIARSKRAIETNVEENLTFKTNEKKLASDIERRKKAYKKLTEEKEKLERKLKTANDKSASVTSQLNDSEEEVARLDKNLQMAKTKIVTLKCALELSSAEISKLKQATENETCNIEELKNDFKKLQEDCESYKNQNSELKIELELLKEAVTIASGKHEEEINLMLQNFSENNQTNSPSTAFENSGNNDIEMYMASLESDVDRKSAEIIDIKVELNSNNMLNEKLKNNLSQRENEIDELKLIHERCNEEIRQKDEEIKGLKVINLALASNYQNS